MGRDDCLAFTHLPAALSFIDIASVKSCLSFRMLVFHVLFLLLELLLYSNTSPITITPVNDKTVEFGGIPTPKITIRR